MKFLYTITYPTSLDSLSNPSSGDLLENADANLDHDQQHSNANDAIEALEAKVGANSSAVTTSHDYKLGEVTGTDKAVGKTATQTLTNKTLTSPILNLSSNATGDMYYRASDGTLARLPIGTQGNILDVSAGGVPEWVANPSGVDASTTTKGVVKLDTAPASATEPIAVGSNSPIFKKLIGVGSESNTTYENYQILYGSANTVWNWTSAGSPTYSYTHILLGSAQGITRPLQIDLATGAVYTWASTKIKIIEWDAKIVADTSTATSYMGFSESGVSNTDAPTYSRKGVGFYTDASGNWKIYTGNGSNNNAGAISTPSAGRHTFRIEYNPATPLVTYYIDGTSVGTLNTYLPSSGDIGLSFSNGTSSTIIAGLSGINISIEK